MVSSGADAFGWATDCHSFERNPYRPSRAGSTRRCLATRRRLSIARAAASPLRGLRRHLLFLLVLHGTTQVGRKAEKKKHHYSCCTPPAPALLTARSCCSQIAHSQRVFGVLGRPPAQSGHRTGAVCTCPLLLANSCQLAKPCIGTAAARRPWHYSSR